MSKRYDFSKFAKDAEFEESKHPRGEGGKFGSGGGGAKHPEFKPQDIGFKNWESKGGRGRSPNGQLRRRVADREQTHHEAAQMLRELAASDRRGAEKVKRDKALSPEMRASEEKAKLRGARELEMLADWHEKHKDPHKLLDPNETIRAYRKMVPDI